MLDIIPNWHPILVHFTVSFISSLGVLQLIIWLKIAENKQTEILFMQKTLMVISTLSLLATLFTGWLAFNSVAHDTPSHMAMTDHRNWASTTAAVFLLSAIIYFLRPSLRRNLVGVLIVISTSLVAVTGFKGGEVVYRYGLGVMSLPQVSEATKDSGDGHDHEHGGSIPVEMKSEHGGHMSESSTKKEEIAKPHLNDGHGH